MNRPDTDIHLSCLGPWRCLVQTLQTFTVLLTGVSLFMSTEFAQKSCTTACRLESSGCLEIRTLEKCTPYKLIFPSCKKVQNVEQRPCNIFGGRFAVCSNTARLTVSATHYHFIREIPLFARYEVRISIASWDDKWVCFIIIAH